MKVVYVVGEKWPEMVVKWPFVSRDFLAFFLTKLKKLEAKKMFYDIVFDLIKIIRSLKASQNDCQILIFVKAIYVVGEKMTRNSGKIVKS